MEFRISLNQLKYFFQSCDCLNEKKNRNRDRNTLKCYQSHLVHRSLYLVLKISSPHKGEGGIAQQATPITPTLTQGASALYYVVRLRFMIH